MIFFGWGKSNKQWTLSDGKIVLVGWSYFHIFWVFRISWGKNWYLLTDNRSQDETITIEKAIELTGDQKINIPFIDRFGWLIMIILLLFINIFL